ncbi:MAG: cell division protein FtsQ/DivIB [Bacteroidetes bacterium]|nr:cell division protein FtsQ/DivIB [Bacteroidota bacterium]
MNRKTRNIALLIGIPVLTLLLFVASTFYHEQKRVLRIQVKIEAEPDQCFLSVADINELLSLETRVLQQPVQAVDLQALEQELLATQYVDSAIAYFGTDGQLMLQVQLRKPVARVLPNGMAGYYLDAEGHIIPLSTAYTARVPLLTGNVPDLAHQPEADSTLMTLVPMLHHIAEDEFWRAHISELYRDRAGDLVLYPTLGELRILFGAPYDYQKKLKHLLHFYQEVLSVRGWRYYKSIALKYDGQIVATKRS